jgi:hypothetical protein
MEIYAYILLGIVTLVMVGLTIDFKDNDSKAIH